MIDRKKAPLIIDIENIDFILPEQWELDNGIKVWGINGGSQELVKIDFIFDAGTWYQPANLIAGLSNSFMKQGTKNYSAQQIAEVFDSRGAYLHLNADQQFGTVSILTLNKYIDEILAVTADVVKNPLFPNKELKTQIAKKKQQFIVENNKVKVLAQKRFSQVVFGENHAYANTNKITDYNNLSREQFVDFHRCHYMADNCRIIVAGLYNDDIKSKLNHYFGDNDWKAALTLNTRQNILESSAIHEHFLIKSDALQSAIRIGRLLPGRNHPDFHALNVLITILGGYFGSRLMTNIREEKGYTYGIGAGIFSLQNASFLSISTEVGFEFGQATLKEIYFEIDRLQNELVGHNELDMVKRYLLGETLRSFDGVFAISNSLRTLIEAKLDYSHYQQFIDKVKSITPNELLDLAKIYLSKNDLYQIVAGKNQ
ncbi:MAG TPA: pitrilysin family protein [Prolixibacteraceae bacterium]|nr:pitrilysin family protein [Prolixibacteraceae bacterium]